MEWIFNQLRERPELAIFLTIFLGFWLGKLRIGKFTLGTVTSVLLVGVLVGQLNIAVPGPIKSVFFLLFLFAVGYKVGPQFFRGLKKDGLPQVGFAVLMCVSVLLVTWLLALMMGYNAGEAAGLLAGSQTISAVFYLVYLTKGKSYLKLSLRYFKPSRPLWDWTRPNDKVTSTSFPYPTPSPTFSVRQARHGSYHPLVPRC